MIVGPFLRRNCLLKHGFIGEIAGRIDETGRRRRRRMQLLDGVKETRGYCKVKKGSARSLSVENWLWTRLRTCNANCWMMMIILHKLFFSSDLSWSARCMFCRCSQFRHCACVGRIVCRVQSRHLSLESPPSIRKNERKRVRGKKRAPSQVCRLNARHCHVEEKTKLPEHSPLCLCLGSVWCIC